MKNSKILAAAFLGLFFGASWSWAAEMERPSSVTSPASAVMRTHAMDSALESAATIKEPSKVPVLSPAKPKVEAASDPSKTPDAKTTVKRTLDQKTPLPQTRLSFKEQLKAQRKERMKKIPYLDRRLIQEMISTREFKSKIDFVASDKPKALSDVLDRAIRSNTEAKVATEKMALSRRKIMVAVRNLFPEASYELGDKGGQLSGANFNSGNYRFRLKQPIFHGGILWNTFLQGKAELEAAENQYDAVLGKLILDVSKAYFDLDRARQQVRDYEEAVESLKALRDISGKKHREGIVSEIENLNAQSLFGDVEFNRENSQQELELAKLEIQKLLNLPMQEGLDVKALYDVEKMIAEEESTSKTAQPLDAKALFALPGGLTAVAVDHLVDLAYLNRPELRVESAKLEAAQLVQKIRFGKFLPQADVTLEMGTLGESFDQVSNDPKWRKEFRCMLELNWNAGGNKIGYSFDHQEFAPGVSDFDRQQGTIQTVNKFTTGILDGLSDFVEAKQAEVQKLEQVVELERAEKKIIEDVKKAYFDYQKNEIQVKSLVQKVNYRKRVAQLKKHNLGQNEIQISEYLEAERDRMDDLAKLHKAVADYLAARASVNYSIGIADYLKFEGPENVSPAHSSRAATRDPMMDPRSPPN